MKNTIKVFGLIALVAVIGFFFAACSDGSGNGGVGSINNPIDKPVDKPTDKPVDNPIDNPVDGEDPTPVAADFTIGNLTQALGSVTPVTITPLPGKSNGERTIYYNGSAALPSAEGSYTVTFDVAATAGWKAATGLPAGTLQIVGYQVFASVSALQSYLYETSDTVVFAKLNSVDMAALKTLLTQMNNNKDIHIDISGSTINAIGASAFYGCTSLVSIILPNSVSTIGDGAFFGSGLVSITIPNSVTSIDYTAFYNCASLTAINVGSYNTVFSSQDGVLYNKNKTTLIRYPAGKTGAFIIPNNVTTIGVGAFSGCNNISVTIPGSVTSMDGAFGGAANLSVTFANDVTSIMGGVFMDCTGITSVNIPNSVTSIEWQAFQGCTGLTGITIPSGVNNIGSYAFRNCTNLNSVTIENGVISIEEGAFTGCAALTGVNIPDSVTSIEREAFRNCTSLASITISDNVTGITGGLSRGAFSNTAWYNNQQDGVVYAGKIAYAYKGAMPFDTSIVLSIVLLDNTKEIANNAFENYWNLVSINIPDSVTIIGYEAFNNCQYLASVTIGSGVTSIGKGVFSGCDRLTGITIPDNVESIGEAAFQSCGSLTSITIPSSVTSIGNSTFWSCVNLTSVTFEGTILSANFDSTAFGSSGGYIGDLRTKFYASDSTNGTPGTYTRPNTTSTTWTKS